MPGSIKIDDGSGNYTILTNAGSLGSDKTITIPNETGTLATTTTSGIIQEADQWKLNADLTSSHNPIAGSYFERNDTLSGMTGVKIGTGMSVDSTSGHWTFPSTGIWKVEFKGATYMTSYAGAYIYAYGTINNGTAWTLIGNENSQGQTTYDRGHPTINLLLDIQDTSTHKIYFRFYDEGSGQLQESTTVDFVRYGDT